MGGSAVRVCFVHNPIHREEKLVKKQERNSEMTNVYATPEKAPMRDRLFMAAEQALRKEGWTVERIPRAGKASVRRIIKGSVQKTASIRTTQDTWIAFPRTSDDASWLTLSQVDVVVAASVDDRNNPQFAQVHLLPADEVRDRFDRAYAARKTAGHTIPVGRGVWVSLYEKESTNPVSFVGAGIGLKYPPVDRVPLTGISAAPIMHPAADEPDEREQADEEPLTIAEAKRRLAKSLGVTEGDIKITING